MFVLSLLLSFTNTSSAALKTELLAVGPGAKWALVRVHSDGFVSIALCPLKLVGPTRLDFAGIESLVACRLGGARLPDSAAARARFDHELEQLAHRVSVDTRDARSLRRIGATSAAIGVIVTASAFVLAPGLIPGPTVVERLGAGALPGLFTAASAALVGLTRGVHAIETEQTAHLATVEWSGARDAAVAMVIPAKQAFETVVEIVDEAMARALETGPE